MLGIAYSLYVMCGIGAFVLFFALQARGKLTFEVLGYINPRWKDSPWCRFFEALIFTVLGAIVACVVTQPTTPQQAIAAGIGWTGLLNGISK